MEEPLAKLQQAFPLERIQIRDGLCVRPLEDQDFAGMVELLAGDPDMSWSRKPWGPSNIRHLLDHRLSHYSLYGFGPYAVMLDDRFVGMAGAQVFDRERQSVELLAYISKDQWGQGLASEVLSWATARITDMTDQSSIFATTRPDNARAHRMVERLGFRQTGLDQEHYGHEALTWEMEIERD
ncbi:GNAT family N-acetyltransferase [Altererythrobacter luteolus]|uniref:GNAT family N-acetyltransferase n=1 Tax=Pontixanthobacter luteolus TaxID=295089 RepID=A0A6I4V1Q8_9SPHN|nr:GNAT family N-acetyltransferase [Pontixanthobacter luteolus]MXP48229.1 GNAT family N-acetyltransferase [Pontixanthobacter luteolus]